MVENTADDGRSQQGLRVVGHVEPMVFHGWLSGNDGQSNVPNCVFPARINLTLKRGGQMAEEANFFNERDDQMWADLLAPNRRSLLGGGAAALAALGLTSGAQARSTDPVGGGAAARQSDKSPWGYQTDKEPTPRPATVRPGEQTVPTHPRAYTDIKSYHAHVYFDEDTYQKAVQIRKWSAERFSVELGNWNVDPRGPHVSPSFYFGFANELLPIIVPWLQLNSLGLTIMLHPNTTDPRADHLYYALWVNRSQPVNAYSMLAPTGDEPRVERIYPNTRPTVRLEV